jgi:hypothetical protein
MRSAQLLLARVLIARGRLAEARQMMERARSQTPLSPAFAALSAYLEARAGNVRQARLLIDNPAVSFDKDLVMAAAAYDALGERDRAMRLLVLGAERHLVEPNLLVYPELDALRSDPRFARMVSTMGLPAGAEAALLSLSRATTASAQ